MGWDPSVVPHCLLSLTFSDRGPSPQRLHPTHLRIPAPGTVSQLVGTRQIVAKEKNAYFKAYHSFKSKIGLYNISANFIPNSNVHQKTSRGA